MAASKGLSAAMAGARSAFGGAHAIGKTAGIVLAALVVLVILNKWAEKYTPESVAGRI